ncbi:MAG TPA: ABC transporter ATP-binding protein [Bryobacteraceae bacterium]|nr:ABC transporter ATP-binding protein [Bryobacteraceae bacterium]
MTAVEVSHLSKNYPLTRSQLGRLRHLFGSERHDPKGGLWALRDVSFSVEPGEVFGIIGANGSGKSTLLQIVAGIMQPTSGSAQVNGRMSTLLELGSGFSMEFSGRDNVYLNASLLGLSREEIDVRFPAIERFAEIGDFMSQPIRTWSTGMVLRLAFAVAAHVDPQVLIVDEALAVGDIAFHQRCMRRIHDLRAKGTTILFVSHATSDVKALCERCLWLQNGVVQELGEADEVVAKYLSASLHREVLHRAALRGESMQSPAPSDTAAAAGDVDPVSAPALIGGFENAFRGYRYGDGRAGILGANLMNFAGRPVRLVGPRDRLVLRVHFRVKTEIASPIAGFLVRNSRGENIFGSNTARENYPLPAMAAGDEHNIDFHWTLPGLAPGDYRISLGVADGDIDEFRMCDYVEDAIELKAAGDDSQDGRGYFRLHCAGVAIYRN